MCSQQVCAQRVRLNSRFFTAKRDTEHAFLHSIMERCIKRAACLCVTQMGSGRFHVSQDMVGRPTSSIMNEALGPFDPAIWITFSTLPPLGSLQGPRAVAQALHMAQVSRQPCHTFSRVQTRHQRPCALSWLK